MKYIQKVFAVLIFLVFGSTLTALADTSVKISIDSGILVGESDDGVNVFKGIPYAKSPVGHLRWAPPQLPERWEGERDVTQYALPCPQSTNPDGKTRNGGGVCGETSEDCLYLNVFSPANAKDAPVMLWVHGGAFFLGAGNLGSYNGSVYAKNGIVIVTINYRLGSLGYFTHPAITRAAAPDEDLGSYGTMDAVAALKWIQRNIGKFGGDKDNVTVFGQSAGGIMVLNLLSIPSAKGLFAKAVVQSGAFLMPEVFMADAEKRGAEIATKLGLPGADATLEQLRDIPAVKFGEDRSTATGVGMGGPVDGRFKVMTTVDALESGRIISVPLMIGSNNGERGFNNARKVASNMSKRAPSFLYQFTYVPEWQKEARPNGAPHAAEIAYVFGSWDYSDYRDPRMNEADRLVAKQMNSCWVAFAKADANVQSLTCADGFSWPKYDDSGDYAVVFEEKPKLVKSKTLPDGVAPVGQRGSMAPN